MMVVATAPAKVNLSLRVLDRLWGGMHEIRSVMQAIDWYDRVDIRLADHPGVRVEMIGMEHPPEDAVNTAFRAGTLFWSVWSARCGELQPGADITVHKRVPWGAGLGGGSANAAAVLLGMNELYRAGFSRKRLGIIGERVGADVPMCLLGGAAQAAAVGNLLTPLPSLSRCALLVCMPWGDGVSTGEAYARLDKVYGRDLTVPPTGDCVDACAAALKAGDLPGLAAAMVNDFELVVKPEETAALRDAMRAAGALNCLLTGSGAAVVGLFADRERARACADRLRPLVAHVRVCMPVAEGAQILQVLEDAPAGTAD